MLHGDRLMDGESRNYIGAGSGRFGAGYLVRASFQHFLLVIVSLWGINVLHHHKIRNLSRHSDPRSTACTGHFWPRSVVSHWRGPPAINQARKTGVQLNHYRVVSIDKYLTFTRVFLSFSHLSNSLFFELVEQLSTIVSGFQIARSTAVCGLPTTLIPSAWDGRSRPPWF
ncbi:hypothetical protein CC78DRAFT_46657 [Lojkania enalia]|uniref:Uncharacterized protein n=1 Tax=Lojkania enalia TaxID=147567 RepID=A0A9P4KFG1_9PLEO|nr:hypothetical protein CC78DRAFT_46657 [Didymosphaeria enalia]